MVYLSMEVEMNRTRFLMNHTFDPGDYCQFSTMHAGRVVGVQVADADAGIVDCNPDYLRLRVDKGRWQPVVGAVIEAGAFVEIEKSDIITIIGALENEGE